MILCQEILINLSTTLNNMPVNCIILGSGRLFLKALMRWLIDEARYKKKATIDPNSWKLFDQERHVPQQHNGYDCGVYTIACADFISDDLPLEYSQQHMRHLRQKYGCAILRGKFNYPNVCKNAQNQ